MLKWKAVGYFFQICNSSTSLKFPGKPCIEDSTAVWVNTSSAAPSFQFMWVSVHHKSDFEFSNFIKFAVVVCSVIVHVLNCGLQLSFGVLMGPTQKKYNLYHVQDAGESKNFSHFSPINIWSAQLSQHQNILKSYRITCRNTIQC